MYIMWIATAMIKKKDRNEYDKEENGVIKSKKAWKKELVMNIYILLICLVCIFGMEFIPIPYVGAILFMCGIYAGLKSIYSIFRAAVVLKVYDQVYSEELRKKLVD